MRLREDSGTRGPMKAEYEVVDTHSKLDAAVDVLEVVDAVALEGPMPVGVCCCCVAKGRV